jgi:uncharacterized damage-inducible protein DinB
MESTDYPSARAMAGIFERQRQHSRRTLLEFLGTITREDFVRPLEAAQGKSIRDLLLHAIDANNFLISMIQSRAYDPLVPERFPTLESVLPVADETADRIQNLLTSVDEGWFTREEILTPSRGRTRRAVPAWILVQMLTHEYHQKGQIMLLARTLGYAPPVSDFA